MGTRALLLARQDATAGLPATPATPATFATPAAHPPHPPRPLAPVVHPLICTLLCTPHLHPPLHPSPSPFSAPLLCTPPLQLLLNVEYVRSEAVAGAPGHEARLLAQQGSYLTAGAAPPQQMEGRQARLQAEAASQREGVITSGGGPPSWAVAPFKQQHDGVTSLAFHSAHPLRLAAFQDLLAAGGAGPATHGEEEEGGVRLPPPPPLLSPSPSPSLSSSPPPKHTHHHPPLSLTSTPSLTSHPRPQVCAEFRGVLARAERIKGVVWFEECRTHRCVSWGRPPHTSTTSPFILHSPAHSPSPAPPPPPAPSPRRRRRRRLSPSPSPSPPPSPSTPPITVTAPSTQPPLHPHFHPTPHSDLTPNPRWVFHISGRQRVSLSHDGEWQGRPQVQPSL